MKEKTYLVYLKDQQGGRSIVAASVEICSEHLVFLDPRRAASALSVDYWADSDE
jgi:hypothetical protein